MGFYAKHILPHVIDLAMRNPAATRLRAEWIPRATGDVLEVGIGSGLNLPFYGNRVHRVYGLDPSPELQRIARRRAADLPLDVQFLLRPAEIQIPLNSESVDTVVLTWTLCSLQNPQAALSEIRRVMKPGARLMFIEHGRSPDISVQAWQHRLTPLWELAAGGCHLDRAVDDLLGISGFNISELKTGYLPGPKLLSFTYCGVARQVLSSEPAMQ